MNYTKKMIELGVPGYGEDEVRFIWETVVIVEPDIVVDWGTNVGASARLLYEATRKAGLMDCEVHTIDLPPSLSVIDRDHAGETTGTWLCEGISGWWGDGVTTALELLLSRPTPLERPLFFIDGDHSYENVFRELTYIWRAAPGATMLLHDTKQDPGRAAESFLVRHNDQYKVTYLASQAGMTRLFRPRA